MIFVEQTSLGFGCRALRRQRTGVSAKSVYFVAQLSSYWTTACCEWVRFRRSGGMLERVAGKSQWGEKRYAKQFYRNASSQKRPVLRARAHYTDISTDASTDLV